METKVDEANNKDLALAGIYCIGWPEKNQYKIGETKNGLAARVSDMSTSWPDDPPYQRFWPCPQWTRAQRKKVEAALHKHYQKQRINNQREWFHFSPAAISNVEETLTLATGVQAQIHNQGLHAHKTSVPQTLADYCEDSYGILLLYLVQENALPKHSRKFFATEISGLRPIMQKRGNFTKLRCGVFMGTDVSRHQLDGTTRALGCALDIWYPGWNSESARRFWSNQATTKEEILACAAAARV